MGQELKTAEDFYKKAIEFEGKNIDSSFYYIQKSYGILKQKDTLNTQFSDVLNQYGRLCFLKQDYKKAYSFFNRCFKVSLATNNEKDAYKVKVNMATCQSKMDNLKKALEDFLDVIGYYEKNDLESLSLGITYFNVAGIYQREKNYEMAESFYEKCIPFFSDRKNFLLQLQGNRIGNFNNFKIDEAVKLANKLESEVDFETLPSYLQSLLYNNIARSMSASKNYNNALSYTLKSLKIKKTAKINHDIAIQYQNIGEIYQQLNKSEISVIYLDSALSLASSNRQRLQILKNLQEGYKEIGDANTSLKYADSYIKLKDSLTEVLTKKELAELGLKYQTKEKENIISRLNQLSLIYQMLLFILLIFCLYAVFILIKRTKNTKKEFRILQKEIDALKAKNTYNVQENNIITLKSKAVLNVDEILYVKSDGHYVEYYVDKKERPEIDRNSLIEVEKELPSNSFLRMHRSYIVNIYRIKIINSTKLMLDTGEWLNVSRTYKKQLKELLQKEVNC